MSLLPDAVAHWPTPTVAEAGKIGNQPNHGQLALSNHPAIRGEVQREKYDKSMHGQAITANWLTPATVQIQRADMQKRIDYRVSIGRQYVPGSLEEQMQQHGQAAPVNPSTDGSRPESWPTPTALNRVRDEETMEKCLKFRQGNGQTSVPLYLEERVNLEEKSWATPRTKDADGWMMNKARLEAGKPEDTLTGQAAQWATATVSTGAHRQKDGSMTPKLDRQVSGKLNPRWVETLMGLPVGWTMPSCQSPVTIAPTNCDCLETELCQPQQNEHSELF
jgi:hypothetical protein